MTVERAFTAVERLLRFAAGGVLAAAGTAMFGQVIARYVFDAPIVWAEEFATLMFAWITFLGAAALQADDSHLSIDTLRHHSPPSVQRFLDLLRRAVIAGCSVLLVYQGIALSARMWPLEFPAMGVTRSLLYLSVPIGFAFALLFALRGPRPRDPADTTTAI